MTQTRFLMSTMLAGGLLAMPQGVHAQSGSPATMPGDTAAPTGDPGQAAATSQPPSAGAPDQEASAADIVVTAQKREERLLDVPIAITAITGDALNAAGAKNLSELQGVAPGVYFSGNTGYSNSPIGIRGTAGTNSTLLDDPVAVYINGVYQPSGYIGSTGLLDVGSIQIVRGPQGTLQGRNATAGAVLIQSANPTNTLQGYIRTSYADPSEIRTEGAISGPITNTLQGRLALGYYNEDGWAHNVFDGGRLGGGRGVQARATLRWRPTSELDVRAIIGHSYTRAEPAVVRYAQTPFSPLATGPLIRPGTATPTLPLSDADLRAIQKDYRFALNRPNFSRFTDTSFVLDATYSFENVNLVSITGYNRVKNAGANDSDGFARTDREGFNNGEFPSKYFSQELRAQSSDSGPFQWILGAYYSSAIQGLDFNIVNLQLTVADRRLTHTVDEQDVRSYAGFVDVTYRFTPEFALIGGVRYTRETKDFELDSQISNYDTGVPIGAATRYRPEQAVYKNTSFRAKATYEPTSDILFYLSYSSGFKSGGFSAFTADPPFGSEKLRSAEAGIKASLLDRRATVALAAYTNRYDNLQVRVGVPAGGVRVTNAADSKIEGFEIEGTLRAAPDLNLAANVTYTHARFSSFPLARNLLDQGPFDAAGNRLPRTPDWEYYLSSRYTPRVSDSVTSLFEASWRYRSRVYLYQTDQTSPTIQGPPLGELGVRAGFTIEPIQLSITAFATNLTDDRSPNNANVTFSYPIVSFNKPRSIGLQLDKKF